MSPEPESGPAPDPRRWTAAHRDTAIGLWAWVMVALVRVYSGPRKSMWERIPNAMCAAARQTTRLSTWLTGCVRALQIPEPGSPLNDLSIAANYDTLCVYVRGLPPSSEASERLALRVLTEDTTAIIAEAMEKWATVKAQSKRWRVGTGTPQGEPETTTEDTTEKE